MSDRDVPRPSALCQPTPASFGLVGASPPYLEMLSRIARFAPLKRHMLLVGETGTGKSALANWLHALSGREGRLVVVNCNALVENLAESLLFGHKAGSFTGATAEQRGLVRAADRGTLFLDEIGDLSTVVQGKLLDVVQRGAVLPVGADKAVTVDVRIVAATHRDLADQIAREAFRLDLIMRMVQTRIEVPPLRQRGEDVVFIARAALIAQARVDGVEAATLLPDAEAWLQRQPWPGNVREVEVLMGMVTAHAPGQQVDRALLRGLLAELHRTLPPSVLAPRRGMAPVEPPPAAPASAPRPALQEPPPPVTQQDRVLALAHRHGEIAPRHLIGEGFSESTAHRRLAELVEAGLLEHNRAFGKAVRYRLARRAGAA